ncbi:MAG: cob(I)yrinic acid a,c-diamide adenosyltransferase [Alphaproteobacteria bacterium]|nr:cob(I)yrinic acid a,c-diamide adenosyltransferase [Alphaproteobacteria bacterium]
MRITKVYTRTGDKGDTRLVGGRPQRKDAARIEAYGTVDELNSVLGLARTFNDDPHLEAILQQVQNDLFNVGTELATLAEDRWEGMYRLGEADVTRLEHWIDGLNEDLEPLKEFILPGGGPVGGFLHQARTVCRRAERRTVTLLDQEPSTGTAPLTYLNRLSDLLFVMARWAAKAHGEPEYTWENPSRRSSER